MPNSLLYNQNIQNKKIKLEQLINEFSLRNKYDKIKINLNKKYI